MNDSRWRDPLVNAYLDSIPLVILNILWFLTLLPIVTALPGTAGLYYATNRLAHGRTATWRDFVAGMRQYFWQSLLWGALNLLAAVVLISNILYYLPGSSAFQIIARVIVGVLAFLWLNINVYLFPLLFEHERPSLRPAFRNSLVIVLKRPICSAGVTIGLGAIIAVSTLVIPPVWIVITASFCAYCANLATIASVAQVRGQPRKEDLRT